MARRNRSGSPVRGYGITPWGRAFAAVVEAGADHRHLTGARRYFRDRHVQGLDIGQGREIGQGTITASVRGSQLDPFEVILTPRPLDPATVVDLLRHTGDFEALLALARGEQPAELGELIAPTESADIASSCTCPDDAARCIHVLAVAFEVADRIDRQPVTLLRVMGTDLPDLLALARPTGDTPPEPGSSTVQADEPGRTEQDWYGDGAPPLSPPAVADVDALAELDAAALRAALRASGVSATQLAEALDDLAELYARLRDRRP